MRRRRRRGSDAFLQGLKPLVLRLLMSELKLRPPKGDGVYLRAGGAVQFVALLMDGLESMDR